MESIYDEFQSSTAYVILEQVAKSELYTMLSRDFSAEHEQVMLYVCLFVCLFGWGLLVMLSEGAGWELVTCISSEQEQLMLVKCCSVSLARPRLGDNLLIQSGDVMLYLCLQSEEAQYEEIRVPVWLITSHVT